MPQTMSKVQANVVGRVSIPAQRQTCSWVENPHRLYSLAVLFSAVSLHPRILPARVPLPWASTGVAKSGQPVPVRSVAIFVTRPISGTAPGRMVLALRPLSAHEKRLSGLDAGLVVEGVSGPWARAGIQPGDLLLAIDGQPSATWRNLAQARASGGSGGSGGKRGQAATGSAMSVAILLQRGGAQRPTCPGV